MTAPTTARPTVAPKPARTRIGTSLPIRSAPRASRSAAAAAPSAAPVAETIVAGPVPGPVPASPAPAPRPARRPGRSPLGVLGLVGLAALVVLHTAALAGTGGGRWGLLPLATLMPAGLLVALGGTRAAAALDRSLADRWRSDAIRGPGRRRTVGVVPSLWWFAAVAVPALVWWEPVRGSTVGLGPWTLPAVVSAQLLEALRCPRTYLWLVLLAPVLLPAFRRYPRACVALPLVVLGAGATGLFDWAAVDGPDGTVLRDLAVLMPCFVLGFAEHETWLGLLAPARTWAGSVALLAAGTAWAALDRSAAALSGPLALAAALCCLGIVLPVLRHAALLTRLPGPGPQPCTGDTTVTAGTSTLPPAAEPVPTADGPGTPAAGDGQAGPPRPIGRVPALRPLHRQIGWSAVTGRCNGRWTAVTAPAAGEVDVTPPSDQVDTVLADSANQPLDTTKPQFTAPPIGAMTREEVPSYDR